MVWRLFSDSYDRDRAPEATAHMKKVLVHLKSLPLKRKLAVELGLTDVLQTLSPHLDEGFLNDVARLWTGMYNNYTYVCVLL